MTIHKSQIYTGELNGRRVHVMPTAITATDVAFTIGSPFGNRLWFDGVRQDSMKRIDFENTFSPIQGDEGRQN